LSKSPRLICLTDIRMKPRLPCPRAESAHFALAAWAVGTRVERQVVGFSSPRYRDFLECLIGRVPDSVSADKKTFISVSVASDSTTTQHPARNGPRAGESSRSPIRAAGRGLCGSFEVGPCGPGRLRIVSNTMSRDSGFGVTSATVARLPESRHFGHRRTRWVPSAHSKGVNYWKCSERAIPREL
jgi:hypothetical protein